MLKALTHPEPTIGIALTNQYNSIYVIILFVCQQSLSFKLPLHYLHASASSIEEDFVFYYELYRFGLK